MNTIDITTATTAELVAFWNAHAEKPVKRFSDRKTAERRVAALIETLTPKVSKKATKAPKVSKKAAKAPNRSAAIAASWRDPRVAKLRSARLHVRVNGAWFRSVPQAFRELQLPMSKCIAFRGKLREAGQLTFIHNGLDFVFELAAKGDEK